MKKRVLSVFVVFTCSCNIKSISWKNNQAPHFPQTINGFRSCYVTLKRFTFLSVETILARTTNISNNTLNWFWNLFKNVHPLSKRQEKGICLFLKRNFAQLAYKRAMRTLIIASAHRLKNLFVQAKFTQTLCSWTTHVPSENNSAIVIPTIRVEQATQCNCCQIVKLVSNKKSILVEMFEFAVTQVDNFCENEFITVMFKLFDGKDASLVLFKPER